VTTISIRSTEPEDVAAVHAILRCPGVVANTLQLPWRPLEYTSNRLAGSRSDHHSLVAVVDGQVVGQLGLDIEPGPRRRDVGKFGMAVHDAYQGQGVGSALMAAMIDLADNWLGLRRLELEVWADNAVAIRLYEKFGFETEGRGRQFARRAGELIDALYMARIR